MNKLLFSKVKDQCKDTGLSEECLKALTEAIGGSIEDDSTDEICSTTLLRRTSSATVQSLQSWASVSKSGTSEGYEGFLRDGQFNIVHPFLISLQRFGYSSLRCPDRFFNSLLRFS